MTEKVSHRFCFNFYGFFLLLSACQYHVMFSYINKFSLPPFTQQESTGHCTQSLKIGFKSGRLVKGILTGLTWLLNLSVQNAENSVNKWERIPASCWYMRNSLHVSQVLESSSTQEEASYFSPSLNLYTRPSSEVRNCARACVFTCASMCSCFLLTPRQRQWGPHTETDRIISSYSNTSDDK